MFFLLPYSCCMVDSLKRCDRVFQDLAANPATPNTTTKLIPIMRGVIRYRMVVMVAPNNTRAMIVTPAREIVITSATSARGMAQAQKSLMMPGKRDVSATTMTGTVVHNSTERLFDSSTVPG